MLWSSITSHLSICLPLRVALVCVLMAGVLGLSHWAGPGATGMLAVYPVSTTCTMLVLHSRLGGRASAAVIANGLWGLLGIAVGLFTVARSAEVLGKPLSLLLGLLAVPVSWNLAVWYLLQRGNLASLRLRGTPAQE